MTSRQRVVIVGASVAGLTAAESLRSEGFDGEILLLGDEPHLPYSRPPLSKQVLLEGWEPERAAFKSVAEIAELRIDFRKSTRATRLNIDTRTVQTDTGQEHYDILIIATGANARKLWPDAGVLTLRSIDDAVALRDGLHKAQRVVVVGAGVLGSEIASAARSLGAAVTLVGRSEHLSFGAIGNALSPQLDALHRSHGVALKLSTTVTAASPTHGGGTHFVFDDATELTADLAVAAVGGDPCVQWLTGSGLTLNNGVVCDSTGLAAPGVYAIGDVAAWQSPTTGAAVRVEHQTNAIEQAMAVAATIAQGRELLASAPFFWSEIHGARIKAYGWFDSQALTEIQVEASQQSALYIADKNGTTQGIVAWNLPPKLFRKARARVGAASTTTTQPKEPR